MIRRDTRRDAGRRLFQLVAVPAAHVATDEVVVMDQTGVRSLLDLRNGTLTPLSVSDALMLAIAFEDACRTSWQTVDHLLLRLRSMLVSIPTTGVATHGAPDRLIPSS